MELFDFVQANQKTERVRRPTWEEVLKDAQDNYEKFGKNLTITKEEYIKDVRRNFEELSRLTSEEYEAHMVHQNIRKNTLLVSLDAALAKQIEKVRQDKKAKEERRLINRLRRWFQRMF